jgi:hypothetical protein
MKKPQLYFLNEDDTTCHTLEERINDAAFEGLEEITLLVAVPDNDNPDYIWCGHEASVGERSECKKAHCIYYKSKSGRGVCEHRGNLYSYGEAVKFEVPPLKSSLNDK